ncbi:hypothetical protein [Streptococcus salivarius]|jgi:hypothetical protein|uniref:hypothetical protein n=1 Tax=Streptococcus salivarius TaxID=1304 RepID=UPI0032F008A1
MAVLAVFGILMTGRTADANASLGDEPTYQNLYQSALYTESSEGGIKEISINYESLAKYPDIDSDADDQVFDYTNLGKSSKYTTEGATLVNTIKVLSKKGWLVTYKTHPSWWDIITKAVGAVVMAYATGISVIIGTIGEGLTDIGNQMTDAYAWVIDKTTPANLIDWVGKTASGTYGDRNWITDLFGAIITSLVGDLNQMLTIVRNVALVVWVIAAGVAVGSAFIRGNLKGTLLPFRKLIIKITVPILFVSTYPSWNNMTKIQGEIDTKKLQTDAKLNDTIVVDNLKLSVASNYDLQVIYPDAYGSLSNTDVMTDFSKFKVTDNIVLAANTKVNEILGEELAGELSDDHITGTLAAITSGKTIDVSEYIAGIEMASMGRYRSKTTARANNLPSETGMSWSDKAETTFDVADIGDIQTVLGKTLTVKGKPIFFDNITPKDDSKDAKESEYNYRSFIDSKSIAYSGKNYQATPLRRGDAWTYLYGIKASNSYMTANLANYTSGKGNAMNDNLTKKIGNKEDATGENADKKPRDEHQKNVSDAKDKKPKGEEKAQYYGKQSKYYQWANNYTIAMFNKYAGTNTTNTRAKSGGFSNQSTAMLLQTTFGSNKLTYSGYYANFSDADKGRITAANGVAFQRYTIPNNGPGDYMRKISILSYYQIAQAILSLGVLFSLLRIGFGRLVGPQWKNFASIFVNGSVAALIMYYITDLTIKWTFLLGKVSRAITGHIITTAMTSLPDALSFVPFVVGFFAIVIAVGLSWRFIKYPAFGANGKVSVIDLIILIALAFSDWVKAPVQRFENLLYGGNAGGNFDVKAENLNGNVKNGGGMRNLLTSAAGSYIGNKFGNDHDDQEQSPRNNPQSNLLDRAAKTKRLVKGAKLATTIGAAAMTGGASAAVTMGAKAFGKRALGSASKFAASKAGVALGMKGKDAGFLQKYGSEQFVNALTNGTSYMTPDGKPGGLGRPKTKEQAEQRQQFVDNYNTMKSEEAEALEAFGVTNSRGERVLSDEGKEWLKINDTYQNAKAGADPEAFIAGQTSSVDAISEKASRIHKGAKNMAYRTAWKTVSAADKASNAIKMLPDTRVGKAARKGIDTYTKAKNVVDKFK